MSEQTYEVPAPAWDTADRLRKALRVAGVGVQEMADYLEVSRNTVGNYINGRVSPDGRTLRLWSMRCGVPLAWLQTGADPSSNPPSPGGRSTG